MEEYYGNNDWRDYLAHYGVKGMKWRKHKYKSEQSYLDGPMSSDTTIRFDGSKTKKVFNHPVVTKSKKTYSSRFRSKRGDYQKGAADRFSRSARVANDFAKAIYKNGGRTKAVKTIRSDANDLSEKARMYTDSYYKRKSLGGLASRTISRGKGTSKKVQKKLSRLKDRAVGYVSKKKKDYEYKRNFRRGVKYTRKMLRG